MKRVRPSVNYQILLPDNIEEEYDGPVSSFWVPEQHLLLQFSSHIRKQGDQVDAATRLRQRIEKSSDPARWFPASVPVAVDPTLDFAAGEIIDQNSVLWIHAYFVWPHLAVYATISGPREEIRKPHNWIFESLLTIETVKQ